MLTVNPDMAQLTPACGSDTDTIPASAPAAERQDKCNQQWQKGGKLKRRSM